MFRCTSSYRAETDSYLCAQVSALYCSITVACFANFRRIFVTLSFHASVSSTIVSLWSSSQSSIFVGLSIAYLNLTDFTRCCTKISSSAGQGCTLISRNSLVTAFSSVDIRSAYGCECLFLLNHQDLVTKPKSNKKSNQPSGFIKFFGRLKASENSKSLNTKINLIYQTIKIT